MADNSNFYSMRISRMTIDKLGVDMYDKVSAVVAELVSNSYDADATQVTIKLPLGEYLSNKMDGKVVDSGHNIIVEDNGHGMTPEEVNEFYLIVGADRRMDAKRGDKSRKGRPVMGHKGIGKLAPFGICYEIEIISAGGEKMDKGYRTAHLILDRRQIINDTNEVYYPQTGSLDGTYNDKTGTTIIMRDFSYKRRQVPDTDTFKRQIASRFGITSDDWKIIIDDTLNPGKAFSVGLLDVKTLEGTEIDLSNRVVKLEDGTMLPVQGVVALANSPYKNEEMAGIRIYVRGKIAAQTIDFGLGAGFHGEHSIRSYLIGELHADWLDDGNEDLIQTNRKDILWSTEKGEALKAWGQDLIRELGNKSSFARKKRTWEIFKEETAIEDKIKEQFQDRNLQDEAMKVARAIGQNADLDAVKTDGNYIKNMEGLIFSVAPHKTLVDKLHKIGETTQTTLDVVLGLFNEARVAEVASLGQVAYERVQVINTLREKIKTDVPESVLQKIIEDAPWLIEPQWTVLSKNKNLQYVRSEFEIWYMKKYNKTIVTSAIDNSTKEPDFVLIGHRGTLEIMEIKKPKHIFRNDEWKALLWYINALKKFLEENKTFKMDFPHGVHTILVCDNVSLDDIHMEGYRRHEESKTLTQKSWQDFLADTERAHLDFLEVAGKIPKVDS